MKQWGKLSGLTAFFVAFAGQITSTIGSAITSFGVSIWLYQQTGQATELTWASAAFLGPLLLVAPFAGTVVDRGNRKRIMILADVAAGMTTIILLLLFRAGGLEQWHIYLLNIVNGIAQAFQWPAFSASVTLIVDKKQYARAAGFMQLGNPTARVIAPAAAAALLAFSTFELLLWVDLATFIFAVITMAFVIVPQPKISAENNTKDGYLAATKLGFTYLLRHPSLLGIQLMKMGSNLGAIFGVAVIVPMILATTGNDEAALATARAIAAAGGIVGGLALGAWGGISKDRDRMLYILLAMSLVSITGIFYGIAHNVAGWAIAGFLSQFFAAFVNANTRAIWQRKIPPDIQGRVFAVQGLITSLMLPIITVIAGPLADKFFEPALLSSGVLASTFGWLVGNSPGSGMSLMFVLGNCVGLAVVIASFYSTSIRQIEKLMPDFDERE